MDDQQPNPTPSLDGITPPAKPTEAQPSTGLSPDNIVQAPANEPVTPPDNANVPAIGGNDTTDPVPSPVTPASAAPSTATPPSAKKKKPVLAIIVAIVIALGLAAATVFLYMKYYRTSSKTSNTSQQASAVTPATTSDVDQASKQLDTSLAQADDSKDFATTAISDQSLGL